MVSRCWLAAFATRAFRFKAFDVVRPWGWDVVGHPGKGLPRVERRVLKCRAHYRLVLLGMKKSRSVDVTEL